MSEPSVRRATPADAATMAALNTAVQAIHHDAHPEVFLAADPATAEPDFRGWLKDPKWYGYLVDDPDGTPVGYVGAHVVSYTANPFMHGFAYLRLDQMAVLPGSEGQGYGTALVRRVKDLATELGIDDIQLNVWTFNERARALYEREGFETFRLEMRARGPF